MLGGNKAERLEYIRDTIEALAFAHQICSLTLQIADPQTHLQYMSGYRTACNSSALGGYHVTRRACFEGLAVVRNMAVEPHRDSKDMVDGYAAMMPWGKFEGSYLVLPELGIKLDFRPGDVILFRSAVLEHYLTK